jgi:uncharacterized protein (TIGR02271 family)
MATNYDSAQQTGAMPESAQGFEYNEGADIFGEDGSRIGGLSGKGVQNGYLVVHHGMLFGKDAYVPLSCVTETRQDGIYLNINQDQLGEYDADEAPQEFPDNVGGTAGGDTWTFEGAGEPAATGEPINQPAPLRMRAPQRAAAPGAMNTMNSDNTEANNLNTIPNTDNTNSLDKQAGNEASAARAASTEGAQEIRVPLAEEELVAGKNQSEAGSVRLHKDVIEEQQTAAVPVTHEEVHLEHRPLAGNAVPAERFGEDVFQEKDIEVPVTQEQVVTGKRVTAQDEVRLSKTPVTEEQQVSDTVRRERLRVEGNGVDVNNADSEVGNSLDQTPNEAQP